MATNEYILPGNRLSVVCSVPAVPVSGDPVMCGDMPGVAQVSEGQGGNSADATSIQTDGVWLLKVKGENAAGTGAAITVPGTTVYYDAAMNDANGAHLNLDATNGKRFGYALGLVGSGATATIPVKVGY